MIKMGIFRGASPLLLNYQFVREKLKKVFWLASLLAIISFLAVGCTERAPNPQPAPVSEVLPAEHPTDWPENLRWLTDAEKDKLIEIALNTSRAQECLQEGSEYTTDISWIALTPADTGKGYSGYRIFDYEIVAEGIPRGTVDITPPDSPERIVSVGVPEEAEIYPCVHIDFAEPSALVVMSAIDLDAEMTVYSDYYPQRRGPVLPDKAPPPRLP